MSESRRRYVSGVLVLVYLCSALYLEVGHTDMLDYGVQVVHRILSHDCTGKEIHHPLGKDGQCPVCIRSSQTSAYVTSDAFLASISYEILAASRSEQYAASCAHPTSSVRGPPTWIV
jgi:hypothetical protein